MPIALPTTQFWGTNPDNRLSVRALIKKHLSLQAIKTQTVHSASGDESRQNPGREELYIPQWSSKHPPSDLHTHALLCSLGLLVHLLRSSGTHCQHSGSCSLSHQCLQHYRHSHHLPAAKGTCWESLTGWGLLVAKLWHTALKTPLLPPPSFLPRYPGVTIFPLNPAFQVAWRKWF